LPGILLVLLVSSVPVLAAEPLYAEWRLYVCALDASALPESRRLIADTVVRSLVRSLAAADARLRDTAEKDTYTRLAWQEARRKAGGALAAKRAERDALFFKGYRDWKYRLELEKLETAIAVLEQEAAAVRSRAPEIAAEPLVSIAGEDGNGLFSGAPPEGKEADFCRQNNADALLTGALDLYYGRFRLRLRLYGAVVATTLFEDTVLFSPENQESALAESAGRLIAAVSNQEPAALAVAVEPADALIVVDGVVAGRGSTGARELPPGSTAVELSRSGFATQAFTLDLVPGELFRVETTLAPLAREALEVRVEGGAGAVYQGVAYAGSSPVTLRIRLGMPEFIQAELSDGRGAQAVAAGKTGTLLLSPLPLADPAEKPVADGRRQLYGAYGRFWLALPAAYLLSGFANTYIDAANYYGDPSIFDEAYTAYYASVAAWTLAGVFLAESIYRVARYVYISNRRSVPLVKDGSWWGR